MVETSASLLQRLCDRPQDDASWQRLVQLYTPFMQEWLRRHGVPPANADDVVQEVFVVLLRELPTFRYDPERGSFRSWLRTVLLNRLREHWRDRQPNVADGSQLLDQLEDPNSNLSQVWAEDHDRFVARRLLELLEKDFEPATWRAFQRQVLEGVKAGDVAAELGMSVGAVYVAKSRVLRRLKEEMQGLSG